MNKSIFIIINVMLITCLSYLGVSGFYHMVTAFAPAFEELDAAGAKQIGSFKSDVKPFADYTSIVERNLFKTAKVAEKSAAPTVDLDSMKETELQLKLWGTVTGKHGKAYAVIEETKERKQNLYREGDAIQNATVKSIYREKVVLSVGGQDEILTMEDATSSKGSFEAAPNRSPQSSTVMRAQKITLRRSQIESAMENVTDLMSQIKVRPHFENGQPDGLKLSSIKPRSIFRKMGLRNGDVITGVDGQRIESVDDALKFYEGIRSASNMSVGIKRRGREKVIEYNIK